MGTKYGYELNPFWNMPGSILISGSRLGYFRNGVYSVDAVLSQLDKETAIFDGDVIDMRSARYQVFAKSLVCVSCGLVGSYFAKEQTLRRQGDSTQKSFSRWHFNLYAIGNPWEEILMTKDHIMPRSKGGSDYLENFQTMCILCNVRKGNKIINEPKNLRFMDGVLPEVGRNAGIDQTEGQRLGLFRIDYGTAFRERLAVLERNGS